MQVSDRRADVVLAQSLERKKFPYMYDSLAPAMFAIMRGPVRVVLWMLIALHAITAVTCLKAGIYSIRSLSKKSCENTYLSYTTSGRTKMQSADAKRPSTWRIMPTSGARGVYTVSPSSTRLSSSKLSYSKLCSSRSVKLSSKGLLSWEMKYVPRKGGNSGFSIIPAGKAGGKRCRDLLGCRSSDRTPTLFSKGSSSSSFESLKEFMFGGIRIMCSSPGIVLVKVSAVWKGGGLGIKGFG